MNPPVYDDADMSATTPPPSGSVYANHTLALVNGAPQSALSEASRASVVAPVVSWVMVDGSAVTTVAVVGVSSGAGPATAGEPGCEKSHRWARRGCREPEDCWRV